MRINWSLAFLVLITADVLAFLYMLQQPTYEEVVITETGSSLAYPIIELWAREYSRLNPLAKINAASTGSGMGIAQAAEGIVDIGASDAYLFTDEQLSKYGDKLVHIPIFIGDVAVVYNIPEAAELNLTAQILSKIYRGEITYWDDPLIKEKNPAVELPHTKITPIYRADSSGTTFLFTAWLYESDELWREIGYGTKVNWPVGIGGDGNQGVVELLRGIKYSIAYVGVAWAKLNNLQIAHIQNPATGQFIKPTLETLMNSARTAIKLGAIPEDFVGNKSKVPLFNMPGENCYPIAGFVYFLVQKDQTKTDKKKAEVLKDFLLWVVDEKNGQKYVPTVDYVPLPPEVSAEVKKLIMEEIKWPL